MRQAWAREASASEAILRSARCPAPDMLTGRLLSAIANTGFFQSGGVLGGTQAFRHYPLELGPQPPPVAHLQTGDMDLLVPSGMRLASLDRSLMAKVADLGIPVETIFPIEQDRSPKWVIGGAIEVELLSNPTRGGKASRMHRGIREHVLALKYLDFVLKDPIDAVSLYRSGIRIAIPSPQRYALHKLLVAQLRSGSFLGKRAKDLDQAEWLVNAMAGGRAFELWEAWNDLNQRGPGWRRLVGRSLSERPAIARILQGVEEAFGPARSGDGLRKS